MIRAVTVLARAHEEDLAGENGEPTSTMTRRTAFGMLAITGTPRAIVPLVVARRWHPGK